MVNKRKWKRYHEYCTICGHDGYASAKTILARTGCPRCGALKIVPPVASRLNMTKRYNQGKLQSLHDINESLN